MDESQRAEPNTLIVEDEALAEGFTIIPNWILRSRGISRDAKILYGILLSYAWQENHCFPGYETLMEDLQCAREALAKYIRELKEKGMVSVQRRGQGRTSIYTLKKRHQDGQKFANRTSRSSETGLPGVRKPKHEKDAEEEDTGEEDPNEATYVRTDQSPEDRLSRRGYSVERQEILGYVQDIARELNDKSALSSSVTRALNLYEKSGLVMGEFVKKVYEARAITKERSAHIKATDEKGYLPAKRKMGYFFGVLENLLEKKT